MSHMLLVLFRGTPLVAGATTFPPVGSVSLDSQSPKGSLRIQFPCHPAPLGALWMLGISGNLSLYQLQRENLHNRAFGPWEMHPFWC